MSSKEKYEKIIKIYKHSVVKHPKGFHTHHIYPKSIWSDAKAAAEYMQCKVQSLYNAMHFGKLLRGCKLERMT